MPYRIRDWDNNFENARSRAIEKCKWVPMPNKQDGMGFTRVIAEPDGAAIYGIWCLIVGACSRQKAERDGWLTDDGLETGAPWTASDLALRWRRPLEEVERALAFLSSDKIGWIEAIGESHQNDTRAIPGTAQSDTRAIPSTSRAAPDGSCLSRSGIEGKEGNKYSVKAQAVFECWKNEMGKAPNTKFKPKSKRYKNVVARIKDGFSVEDLCLAVLGCKNTPHNMGQNDRSEKYNDLELICRDVEHVERFIEKATGQDGEDQDDCWTAATKELIALCESRELKAKIGTASKEAQQVCSKIGLSKLEGLDMASARGAIYSVADRLAGK